MTDGEKKSRPAARLNMPLAEADRIATKIWDALEPYCDRHEAVGSVRRREPYVNDIDMLCQLKREFGVEQAFEDKILELCSEMYSNGKAIKSALIDGVQVDFYIATPATYDTLQLIRTGSAAHNVKLTSLAKRRGWKLHASGKGLTDERNEIIAHTEHEILKLLLGKYVEPEARN